MSTCFFATSLTTHWECVLKASAFWWVFLVLDLVCMASPSYTRVVGRGAATTCGSAGNASICFNGNSAMGFAGMQLSTLCQMPGLPQSQSLFMVWECLSSHHKSPLSEGTC